MCPMCLCVSKKNFIRLCYFLLVTKYKKLRVVFPKLDIFFKKNEEVVSPQILCNPSSCARFLNLFFRCQLLDMLGKNLWGNYLFVFLKKNI
jgi:hypothetical protein